MIESAKEFYNNNARLAFVYSLLAGVIGASEAILPLAKTGFQTWIELALAFTLFIIIFFMLLYFEMGEQRLKKLLVWLTAIFIFSLIALVIV